MPNFGPDFVPSTTLTSDLIREALNHAQGANKQPMNVVDADFVGGDQMVLRYPLSGVQAGQRVEVGWSEYVVVDTDTAVKTLTVIPELPGTVPNHPVGTLVTIRPRYTALRVIAEINNELKQLSAEGLYRIVTVDADEDGVIALPDGALKILDTWGDGLSTDHRTPSAYYEITESATGPVLIGPDTLTRATIGCAFNLLPTDVDALVSTTGIWQMAEDIPPLGAAMRLLAGTESQRNIIDHQGETRRAGEVPPGGPTGAMRNMAALRQTRVVAEEARLLGRYGYSYHPGVH